MNGRVYDPKVGRFLSVDPVFQFPENTQSLNPYTYVLNSALSFSDPTGFTCDGEDDNGCKEKTKARENSEARDKRAEQKAKDRGASITHFGRSDTTSAERQAGVQTNGAKLEESERGKFAFQDPDTIGGPMARGQGGAPVAGAADTGPGYTEREAALGPSDAEGRAGVGQAQADAAKVRRVIADLKVAVSGGTGNKAFDDQLQKDFVKYFGANADMKTVIDNLQKVE